MVAAMRSKVEQAFSESELSKIHVFTSEDLFDFIERQSTPVVSESSTETTIKGYRVKVSYDSVSDTGNERKRASIAKLIVQSINKEKEKK